MVTLKDFAYLSEDDTHCHISIFSNPNSFGLKSRFYNWTPRPVPKRSSFSSSPGIAPEMESCDFFCVDAIANVSNNWNIKIPTSMQFKNLIDKTVIKLFGKVGVSIGDSLSYHSICVNVHGFNSYVFARPTVKLDLQVYVHQYKSWLQKELDQAIGTDCVAVEAFRVGDLQHQILDLQVANLNRDAVIFKFYAARPSLMEKLVETLIGLKNPDSSESALTLYEDMVSGIDHFFADCDLKPSCWIRLPAEKYYNRTDSSPRGLFKESKCQIEVDVHMQDLQKVPETYADQLGLPPLRIISIDFETLTDTHNDNMEIGKHAITKIGLTLYETETGGIETAKKAVLSLGMINPINNVHIECFAPTSWKETGDSHMEKEKEMVLAMAEIVQLSDVDIIMGFSVSRFDLPTYYERVNRLNFSYTERIIAMNLGKLKNVGFQLYKLDERLRKYPIEVIPYVPGTVVFDLHPVLYAHDNKRVKGYCSLEGYSTRYLEVPDQKHSMPFYKFNYLQLRSVETRTTLASYCVNDAYVCIKLLLHKVFGKEESIEGKNYLIYQLMSSKAACVLLRHHIYLPISITSRSQQLQTARRTGYKAISEFRPCVLHINRKHKAVATEDKTILKRESSRRVKFNLSQNTYHYYYVNP